MGFAEELWDGFDIVVKRISDGKKFGEEVSNFVKKLQEIERDYSKKIIALCKSTETPGSLIEAWKSVKLVTESRAKKHQDFGDALTGVIQPIQIWRKETSKERKRIKTEGTKLSKDVVAGEQKVLKAKAGYEVAKRALDTTERSFRRDPKKLAVETKAAEKADQQYQEAVKQMQELEAKFLDTEMPQLLSKLEKMDASRISALKTSLEKYVTLQSTLPLDAAELDNTHRVVEQVDAEAEIRRFILENSTRKEKPARTVYEPLVIKPPNEPYSSLQQVPPQQPTQVLSQSQFAAMSPSFSAPLIAPQHVTSNQALRQSANAPLSEKELLVQAKYDYTATEEKELTIKKGDVISVLKQDASGWWYGTTNGRIGLFPSNYVEVFAPQPQAPISIPIPTGQPLTPSSNVGLQSNNPMFAQVLPVGTGIPPPVKRDRKPQSQSQETSFSSLPVLATQSQVNTTTAASPSPKLCRVLFDYTGENEFELTIRAGETLAIDKLDDDGWYRGTNTLGQYGRFPSNFVNLLS